MAKTSSAKPKTKKSAALTIPTTEFVIQDDQIPDTIPGVVKLIGSIMGEVRKASLVYAWNIGKVIKKIQEEEGRYGSGAVEQIAQALGQSDRLFWEMLRFYNYHEDFNRVKGMAIEWSSAREIMRLPDPKQRTKLEDTAEKDNLTVREVREEVNKAKGKPAKKEKTKKKEPNALPYFMKLDTSLNGIISTLDGQLKDITPMLSLVGDEERTPDEDYKILVEGTDKKDPMMTQLSKKAVSIIEKLTRYVVSLKDTFNENEDSESDGSEEEN